VPVPGKIRHLHLIGQLHLIGLPMVMSPLAP
jgi:hypothetical protein